MHKMLIKDLRRRYMPVDSAMCSDIFSVSFYRQEFQEQLRDRKGLEIEEPKSKK